MQFTSVHRCVWNVPDIYKYSSWMSLELLKPLDVRNFNIRRSALNSRPRMNRRPPRRKPHRHTERDGREEKTWCDEVKNRTDYPLIPIQMHTLGHLSDIIYCSTCARFRPKHTYNPVLVLPNFVSLFFNVACVDLGIRTWPLCWWTDCFLFIN